MLDKPHGRSVHIWHDHRALDLDKLCSMMEVDSNCARDTLEEKVKLEEDSLDDPSLIIAYSLN